LFIFLSGCGKKVEKQYPQREDITQSVYASGTIKSKGQYEVYSKVAGIIEAILVKEGDLVKKGQTIIHLANTAQSLNYENAKQNAQFNSTITNKEKIEQAKTELELAKSKMDNEASLLSRQEKLLLTKIDSSGRVIVNLDDEYIKRLCFHYGDTIKQVEKLLTERKLKLIIEEIS
jgi:multidrug efflux pump subunit AcrA (membrane-fusion protein)